MQKPKSSQVLGVVPTLLIYLVTADFGPSAASDAMSGLLPHHCIGLACAGLPICEQHACESLHNTRNKAFCPRLLECVLLHVRTSQVLQLFF